MQAVYMWRANVADQVPLVVTTLARSWCHTDEGSDVRILRGLPLVYPRARRIRHTGPERE